MMTHLTPSEAALKRKAEAATPGLRAVHSMDGEFYQVIVPADTTGVTVICQRAALPDALLIAVANPAEILALLATIERLRGALGDLVLDEKREASFTDANGRVVKIGDRVQFRDGRNGVMQAIFQDGSGYVRFDGERGDTDINWKHIAKWPDGMWPVSEALRTDDEAAP